MRSSTAVFVAAAVGRNPNQTIAVTWIPTSVTRVQVDGEAVGVFITQRNVTVCKYISVGQMASTSIVLLLQDILICYNKIGYEKIRTQF